MDEIIVVLSYSFQLAGALLLLLWCIGNCDAKVVKGCFDNHPDPLWRGFDEKGTFTKVSKSDLQESAKNIYLNIATFADLAIGYTLAIFMTDVPISPWCILLYAAVAVVLILAVEYLCICKIAKKKYNADRKIYEKSDT